MSTTLTGQQFIGGERSGQGQALLASVAAADGSHHDLAYFQATVEEVEQAVAAAVRRRYPPPASTVSGGVPAGSYGCLPRCCAEATF